MRPSPLLVVVVVYSSNGNLVVVVVYSSNGNLVVVVVYSSNGGMRPSPLLCTCRRQ